MTPPIPIPLHFDLPPWMFFSFVFIIGAVIGSFLNVCVYRIPPHVRLIDQLRALWDRPSQCPRCKTNIRWFDNIPIFGWIKLRGRCRDCKMWISPRYPIVEFVNGCLFVLVFIFEVPVEFRATLADSSIYSDMGPQQYPGLGWLSPEQFVLLRYAYHMVMIEALLVATLIDYDLRIIPDAVTLPPMIFAIMVSTIFGTMHIVPIWVQQLGPFQILLPDWMSFLTTGEPVPPWIDRYPHLHGFESSVVGAVIGGGIVWVVRGIGSFFLREEAMGEGDGFLMAMVGAFLGWQATAIAFFIAPIFALMAVALTAVFVRDRAIPYGPYLSLGTLITILYWQQVAPYGMQIFGLGIVLLPLMLLMTLVLAMSLSLVYVIKRMLGLLPVEGALGVWRAADQNCFFAGEKVQRYTCEWHKRDWEGCASGRGTVHEERWRNGHGNNFGGSSSGWRLPQTTRRL